MPRPIEQLLPHAAPMILLDSLVSADEEQAVCLVNITPDSAFYNSQRNAVASYIGIEYMAQAIAAYAGVLAHAQCEAIRIGFLIGSRKVKIHHSEFKLGATLLVTVVKLYQEESGLSVFDCKIECQGQLYVEAKLNVFQPQNPEQFIKEQP